MDRKDFVIISIIVLICAVFGYGGWVSGNIGITIGAVIFALIVVGFNIDRFKREKTADTLRKVGFDEETIREETEDRSDRYLREIEEYKKAHNTKFFVERRMEERELGRCPNCNTFVGYDGRIVCLNCGIIITPSAARYAAARRKGMDDDVLDTPDSEKEPELSECPYCKTPFGIVIGDYCPQCGKRIPGK